jgi:hypothetical protein
MHREGRKPERPKWPKRRKSLTDKSLGNSKEISQMGLVLKRNIWMILASPLTQATASQTLI